MKASVNSVAPITKGGKTILTKANAKSYSLRTTVPKGITNQFDLKEGDSLLWVIRPAPDGKNIMIVVETEKANQAKRSDK